MQVLWRGSWATRTRILTGLVLMAYVSLHLVNIALSLLSPEAADAVQDVRGWVIRSWPGTVVLYGALGLHATLALGKVAIRGRLRLSAVDLIQVSFGVTIPLLLVTHVVFTRISHEDFATHDTVGYISGLIWNSASGWWQAVLLIVTWVHGCIGLHLWLRLTRWWRRGLPWIAMLGALVPAAALAGYISEGRRVQAVLWGSDAAAQQAFYTYTNWPDQAGFQVLTEIRDQAWWAIVAFLALAVLVYLARQMLYRTRRTLTVAYVDGPTIQAAPGPSLLQMSQAAGVPHMALCGGRGRCTTCRVLIEDGAEHMPPPSDAEQRALRQAGALPGARLACQVRPTGPARIFRQFRPDGRRQRKHASEGKEAQLAILFLDMRGFTARTTGQLPYDVVHLLNRFFDAIVPPINAEGGTVDKYLGDGLLAVFETEDAASSARAGLRAAKGIGVALDRFNAALKIEGGAPIRIGLSLHLGTVVLGEIGAAGQAPRTLIGDTVNTASRMESETKARGVQALISEPLLTAAGVETDPAALVALTLRGVALPIPALPVHDLAAMEVTPDATLAV